MIDIGKDSERVTAAERYARATSSTDLTPALDRRTDADKLIAAGWAAQGDPKKAAALDLYRMAVNGNTQGLMAVVDTMDGWLNGWTSKKGRKPMPKFQRRELVASVLHWWIKPTCGYCEGRGFELVPRDDEEGAQALNSMHCKACRGTGKRPLAKDVPDHLIRPAEALADELDRLILLVTGEMARRLAPSLEVAP